MDSEFLITWKPLIAIDPVYQERVRNFLRDPLQVQAAMVGTRCVGHVWLNPKNGDFYCQSSFTNLTSKPVKTDLSSVRGPFPTDEEAKAFIDCGWMMSVVRKEQITRR